MEMNSCLYEAVTTHTRFSPKQHHFFYRLFMVYLDLDELDSLNEQFYFFWRNKFNVFSFWDEDHIPPKKDILKNKVLHYLETQAFRPEIDKIMLLTFPRVLGYIFNPVSFYFCYDRQGRCRCAIAEVGNTFNEMKLFLIGPRDNSSEDEFHSRTTKYFYVSPFIDLDVDFDFHLHLPGEKLEIRVEDYKKGEKILAASLTGKRVPLTEKSLVSFFIKYPFITLWVTASIHWNALLLYFKGIKYHKKDSNLSMQRDVLKNTNYKERRSV